MKKVKKSFGHFFVRPILSGAVFALSALMVFGVVAYAQVGSATPLIEKLIGSIDGATVGTGHLSVQSNGDLMFSPTGGQLIGDQNGSLELGGINDQAGNGSPYIDFHSGDNTANGNDYNVRLINDVATPDTLRLDGSFNVTGDLDVLGALSVNGQPLGDQVINLTWGSAQDVSTINNTKSCPTNSYVSGISFTGITLPNPEIGASFSINYTITCRAVVGN
jgi:hypothetical protein